jgi:diguanylate cyclase (GGDEF)-like protein
LDIRERSSQFSVYISMKDLDQGATIKVALAKVGYDAHFFQDDKDLDGRLRERPAHLVFFSTVDHAQDLNEFIEKVRSRGEDIRFAILGAPEQFEVLSEYQGFGVEEILSLKENDLPQRALWATDRICEKIYLRLQNEQLFEDLRKTRQGPPVPALANLLAEYNAVQSKEELIQKFMSQLTNVTVYLKYVPTMGTFVATHSQGFEAKKLKGVGSQLTTDEGKNLLAFLGEGKVPGSLAQVLTRAFDFTSPKLIPVFFHHQLEGIFAHSGALSMEQAHELKEKMALFSLVYSHFCLQKKVEGLEVLDFVTEVFNRRHYLKTLHEELERARRARQPLSVVKIAIDDFYEIEQAQGEAIRDHVLKSVATIISRTSRLSDVTCRTGMNELAMILPVCSRKGAALRAERLRRIVESTPLLESGKISISLGISEYPSLCSDDQSLDETSTSALVHISDKGGNKICLYKAPQHHKPEFEVSPD